MFSIWTKPPKALPQMDICLVKRNGELTHWVENPPFKIVHHDPDGTHHS
jgi:hypothetical protein